MISKIARVIVKNFIHSGHIEKNELELYEYGVFILLSNILFISITALLGLVFGLLPQSLIFFVVFTIIRQYAGGYHASTELRCEFLTTLGILASIVIMSLITSEFYFIVLVIITFILSVFIFIFAPIDTDEKVLDETELKVFCKRTKVVLIIVVTMIIVSFYFKIKTICIPCCISLILEGVLLIAGKLKKIRMGKRGET